MSFSELNSLLKKYGQEHLLEFWNEISTEEREYLIEDIARVNLPQVMSYFDRASKSDSEKKLLDEKLKPVPNDVFESVENCTSDKILMYEEIGLKEIANGRVAVVSLAGGQGTRLGVDFPKGMYDIGLPSKRSLFHIQALRIRRLQNLAKAKYELSKGISWYIMTSDATHDATLSYFEENDYFNLDKSRVIMFKQSTLPCLTFDGKIILDEKHKISRAPDGNGGFYVALKKEGILDDMKSHKINSVHVFSVDNALVRVADPVFVGYCISRSADCGVKVLKKRSEDECVGVVCQVDGLYSVVEYSEISPATAKLRDAKGQLLYNAGNICNHYFTHSFLENVSEKYGECLDLHIAKKKISFIDTNGKKCKPSAPNGIKMEKFIFDSFKYSQNFAVWEVLREEEFCALKNPDSAGVDCPSDARRYVLDLHKQWLLSAGATSVEGDVEVCPLLSYRGEDLTQRAKNKSLKGPICLM
ncbi:hypothetical protein QAD02_016250 [Eretmocerus hayati]|uniref:Uncharacterized protein n=1 Tax=Eretmocerus hayati TaxID=131215 RepID=A0ACC2PBK0_9HYME|nr:hypothetical protein QAD02_016250 [Eretmocerus hayati]